MSLPCGKGAGYESGGMSPELSPMYAAGAGQLSVTAGSPCSCLIAPI